MLDLFDWRGGAIVTGILLVFAAIIFSFISIITLIKGAFSGISSDIALLIFAIAVMYVCSSFMFRVINGKRKKKA